MSNITKADNYEASKYNAVKHGVLSREAVLSWEKKEDYDSLLTAFESDYEPEGITETYLTTELAQVVWRKRRLRMAEKTITKSNLINCDSYSSTTVKKALYAHPEVKRLEKGDVETAFRMSDKEAKEQTKVLQKTIRDFEKLLEQNLTYDGYMEAIDDSLKSSWSEWLEEPQYNPDIDSFRRFIKNNCIDYYRAQLDPLLVRNAIKEEALCESSEPTGRIINLSRYETTLDRKFERTLAMLIKLQDLRGKDFALNPKLA